MKADPAAQRRLLDLAEVDAELGRVHHRRTSMPELAEITAAEQAVRACADARVAVQTQLDDLDREVTRQEKEIDAVRAREERDRGLMAGGTLNSKALTDMEHEMATLKRRRSVLEDDLLELMERREAVGMDAQHAGVALAEAEQRLAEVTARRDENLADLDTTQARRDAERATIVPGVPAGLLALYERKRAARGIGAALLRARRCGSCQIEIDRRELSLIKESPADEVVEHEECGVILVRTAESGV
ncbi:hypothetical protein L6E12_33145 [Actinokineospora sp. PR83]|uniref:zinc ribbon domain-containing protein n=1 Tax=Actinokineospora sp. PR83 TaxID=2884908 RepID=UPI0027DFDD46|nr:hypothetical protein [Actinokineospora sp. PR83]MCG8920620.1 hypothetical protein [Actinokineospora sp. PR83]